MEKLVLIDGHSIINRAFYGVPELTNSEGLHTNGVYRFLNIMLKILDEEGAGHLAVAFDLPEPTFRHKMYDAYKGTRKPMPEELREQVPVMKEVLQSMGICTVEKAGLEADDILGTLAKRGEKEGMEVALVSGDRDLLQIASDHIKIRIPKTKGGKTEIEDYYASDVQEAYQVTPVQFIELKALMGDASDNVPGVPGVGEKTALALLRDNGTLAEVYARLDQETLETRPVMKKRLAEGRESAFLSYDLCTIRRDAPLDFTPEETLRKPANTALLLELFQKLDFQKLIAQMGLEAQGASPSNLPCPTPQEVVWVREDAQAQALLDQWQGQTVGVLALPDLTALAVCWGEKGDQVALFQEAALPGYQTFLAGLLGPGIPKLGYHSKDVMSRALDRGLTAEGFVFDGAIAAYLLSPTDGSYDLDKVGAKYFGVALPPAKDYLGAKAWKSEESAQKAGQALAHHVCLLPPLYRRLPEEMAEFGLTQVYEEIERPLCPVLAEMEQAGVLVDQAALAHFGQTLQTGIEVLQGEIYAQAGEKFNINSTQQLGRVLFEGLGLPPVKKTKTGYSTSAEVLEKLRPQHPIIDLILEYRQLTKLNSTYVEGLAKVIAPDGRIHTSFQNTVTATGRLSSTEPNLQNIPVRTELGAQIRTMFIARPGWVLVDADYSQIELRLLAHMAGDEKMIAAFQSGQDIHAQTASQVFGLPPEEVTGELRRRAKAVNFGIVYGISDFSLAQDIGVSRQEAADYMNKYLATFSGVREYMEHVKTQAKEDGYVATLMGRRRWLPELKSTNYNLRAFGERVALNMPIQGTAADVMKLAMIRVARRLKAEGLRAQLILQVHDELIVECPQEEADQVKALLTQEMEGAGNFSVPLVAEAGAGRSWAEAKG